MMLKLNPEIWLPFLILAYLIPFILVYLLEIRIEQLRIFRFYILYTFFVIAISGYLLTWLSFRYEQKRGITEPLRSFGFQILLIVSTIIAVLSVLYLPKTSSFEILIAFALTYIIIFNAWWRYNKILNNFNSVPEFRDAKSFLNWCFSPFASSLKLDIFFRSKNYKEPTQPTLEDISSIMLFPVRFINSSFKFIILLLNPTSILYLSIYKSIIKDLERKRTNKEESEIKHTKDKRTESVDNFSVIFYTIFGIIAGLAITQSLGNFNENLDRIDDFVSINSTSINSTKADQGNFELDNTNLFLYGLKLKVINILVLISFFVIATPFYHTAATFLSNKELIFALDRKQGTAIFHFIILLVQVSILFLVAANVNILEVTSLDSKSSSLEEKSTFLLSLILMISIDILWTSAEIGPLKNQIIPKEWLYINLITILFLFCITAYMNNPSFSIPYLDIDNYTNEYLLVYFVLLLVLFMRTILNYHIGWKGLYRYGLKKSRD